MRVKRCWALAVLCVAGCGDDDAIRFGPDGSELAEYRFESNPSVRASTNAVTLSVNESLRLSVQHRDQDGMVRDVSGEAEWVSQDPAIAWVQRGTVVAVFPGITQIDVSYEGMRDSVAVAVTPLGLQAIEVEPSTVAIPKGLTATLRAIGVFRQDAKRDITRLVHWEATDASVVFLDGNQVRGLDLGVATVEATLNDITGSRDVTVTSARLFDLQVVAQRDSMAVGATQQLRARGRFSDDQTIDVTDLAAWSSNDGNLATIEENGLVHARRAGEVALHARYLGYSAQLDIAITDSE